MQTVAVASFVIASFVAATGLVPAYAGTAKSTAPVIGYQDPQTGAFRPLSAVVPEATTVPTTGTVKVTFNVKLVTPIPKGTDLLCSANLEASVISTTTGAATTYAETADEGVVVSGTTATCVATIPYSWVLLSTGTAVESFLGSYVVLATVKTTTGGVVTTGLINRSSSGVFASSKTIPASGTSSSYTVNVTL